MDKMTGPVWTLTRFTPALKSRWDEFVAASRNATFLFKRDYMDYHSDRFADHSLLAWKGNRLMALLPANETPDGILHSHQGLTYGGWVLPERHLDGSDLLEIFGETAAYCRLNGFTALDYKPLPFIYAKRPSQEDLYALFRMGATVSETTLSSAILLDDNPGFNTLQRRHLRKASDAEIRELDSPELFWPVLEECLSRRHNATPVHSLEEIRLLKGRFPANIRFFAVFTGDLCQAGVCVFDTSTTAHCQYIATTEEGRMRNLLTPLFHHLIHNVFSGKRYFDFGTSNEEAGTVLNSGLLRQKFSYGASGVACQRFLLRF